MEIGHDDADCECRRVDPGAEPVDCGPPVLDRGVLIRGPVVRRVGGEDQLKEAQVGEAAGRDEVSEEHGSPETLLLRVVVGHRPGRHSVVIVHDKAVAGEEDELGVGAQGPADEKEIGRRRPALAARQGEGGMATTAETPGSAARTITVAQRAPMVDMGRAYGFVVQAARRA